MRAAIFFGLPVIYAVALLLVPSRPKSFWLWCLAVCALLHVALYGYLEFEVRSDLDFLNFLKFASFLVVIPWLVVAIALLLSSIPRQRALVSLPLPFIWAGSFLGSYILGLELGILYK